MKRLKAPDPLGGFAQHRSGYGALQLVEQRGLVNSADDRQQLEVELAADHRCRPQRLERVLAEALDAALDHLAHALGQRDTGRAVDAPAPGGLVEDERTRLRQAPEDLAHEKRVAIGLGRNLGCQLDAVRFALLAPIGRDQLDRCRFSRCCQANAGDAAKQRHEPVRQGWIVDLHRDGAVVPAVLIVNKTGLLFTLNRVTGKPIFDIEERPVPKSDVPG